MYAIVETGGKQFKVSEGTVLRVERLDVEVGSELALSSIMVVDGEKITNGGNVTAKILSLGKAKKIIVYKYKAKKGIRKKQGHRQYFTELKITSIKA